VFTNVEERRLFKPWPLRTLSSRNGQQAVVRSLSPR